MNQELLKGTCFCDYDAVMSVAHHCSPKEQHNGAETADAL